MDSVDQHVAAKLQAAGVPFHRYPVEKDETDLEIALHLALDLGASEILIAGALGARIDHTLGNLALLALPALAAVRTCIVDGGQAIWLVRNQLTVDGQPGDTLSLIPFGGDACGVTLTGVHWPLIEADLPLGPSLSISNRLESSHAEVSVRAGALLRHSHSRRCDRIKNGEMLMRIRHMLPLLLLFLILAACAPPVAPTPAAGLTPTAASPQTLVVMTHDSFAVSEDIVRQFEQENNATVEFLKAGDAGEALNKACLSKDNPLADVFFGVDNTFFSRAIDCGIFQPYRSPSLANIEASLQLDPAGRLLPADFGYVTLNYDKGWFEQKGLPVPQTLEDLIKPEYKGLLVVENPATSSPGLAFLLTTIAVFGDPGYLDFWGALRANDVLVVDGWSEAYFTHFTVGSGGEGDRPLVVSYSTSPAADVYYSEGAKTEPDSGSISPPGQTYRQTEFVGILVGAKQRELAQSFVDFMLGTTFQEDIPLQMFVYPANNRAKLPDLFKQFAEQPKDPVEMNPNEIEANRERWVEAWTEVVLR